MAVIVVYNPSDPDIPNVVTEFNKSAHSPDYSGESNKLTDPDLTLLWTAPDTFIVPLKHWKYDGTSDIVEMSQGEKDIIDADPLTDYRDDDESDEESTTTSTNFVDKVSLDTPDLPSAEYKIEYSYELAQTSSGDLSLSEVALGSEVIAAPSMESDGDWHSAGGFAYRTFSGIKTLVIRYRTNNVTNAARIRRARIRIERD